MATPRRRSSRLRSSAIASQFSTMPSPSKLSSLLERDESPPNALPSIDALVSPETPSNTSVLPQEQRNAPSSPQTAARLRAGQRVMHPSKVQSTNKAVAEFSGSAVSRGSLPNHMSSPGFDFSFDSPESDLSADAQKIMEGVREQAARIKARMQEERDRQQVRDGETDQLYGVAGRNVAKLKGKSGRYSDAHKQQFRKMDSIANHPSTWKNNIPANTISLKRSGSKAGLDDPPHAKGLPKTASSKSLHTIADAGRLENTASGKRAKKRADDDTSTTRLAQRENTISKTPATSAVNAAITNLPSAITTPTKASLARTASVKSSKSSMIPSLSRSNSTKTLASPAKSEGSNKYFSSLARFGNVKSILSRHQPKFSNDPVKIAAGTHLPMPPSKINHGELSQAKMDLNKGLPNIPGAFPPSEERAQTVKRVVFTPTTKPSQDVYVSPSHSKIPSLKSPHQVTQITTPSDSVTYPSLVNSPNITHRPTKSRETPSQGTPSAPASPSEPVGTPSPSKPTDFTFTSTRTLDFGAQASTPKPRYGASTIRQVRPSGITTPLTQLNAINMPTIAHGMPNKKRKYAVSDDEDLENFAPDATAASGYQKRIEDDEEEDGPRTKKVKMTGTSERKGGSTPWKSPQKKFGDVSRIPKHGNATPKGKGKGVLSLSRLNMLARPKDRR